VSTEEGFIEKNKAGESKVSWSSIESVGENENYYFLFLGRMNAHVLPKGSFPDEASREEFKRKIVEIGPLAES